MSWCNFIAGSNFIFPFFLGKKKTMYDDDPIVSFKFFELFSHISSTSTALFTNLSLFSSSPFCNAGLDI